MSILKVVNVRNIGILRLAVCVVYASEVMHSKLKCAYKRYAYKKGCTISSIRSFVGISCNLLIGEQFDSILFICQQFHSVFVYLSIISFYFFQLLQIFLFYSFVTVLIIGPTN